jgi:hypothetical protein
MGWGKMAGKFDRGKVYFLLVFSLSLRKLY